ncbi:MAG: hypothetical protein R3293_20375 [Candidatus Promineifilaceae bacterium]|nr:hypothetical protein [Candidatus Promineifilaceae bacterium]
MRLITAILILVALVACSTPVEEQNNPGEGAWDQAPAVAAIGTPAAPTATTPPPTMTATATQTPTPTATPSPTATPVIKPANISIEKFDTRSGDYQTAVTIQHETIGSISVIDELILDTPFTISWTDDNPQTAVLRFRNEDDIIVERTAGVDPGHGELPIESANPGANPTTNRHLLTLNTAEFFPVFSAIERMATIEIADADGHIETHQILFSRHDYEANDNSPKTLAQPQYDQLELGIDWRSEQYALQGTFAEWLNSHPELWWRVTIHIEGRDPFTWQALREDDTLLHRELAAAQYEDNVQFTYLSTAGLSQPFARDTVPYYTKFEIVHSPDDEQEFYTIRAGRDPGVSEDMLHEMGNVVRHMFTNRPNYLHELALNKAVHSVAPGKDMLVLPELSILPDDVVDVIIDDEDFGAATGIALLERHKEISASAGHYFENDAPILGYTLIHELVHQVQYMIYGPSWSTAVDSYYQDYMALPRRERIPDIDYYETHPWEWDAFMTTVWFAEGSDLYDHVEPYLDLQLSDTGTTIREHLQRRWGDPLPAYEKE